MKNKLLKVLITVLLNVPCMALFAFADYGEMQGYIKDAITGETLPEASITYLENNNLRGAYADGSGYYKVKPMDPGTYDITFSFTGYQKIVKKGVVITAGTITFLNIQLTNDNSLPPIDITWFQEPLIRKDFTGGVTKLLQEDIALSVARDIKDLVAQSGCAYQKEEGGSLNIRGSRANATQYYVDGIKMFGGFSLPKAAIQEISVISGGIPAQYGDVTGGIVVIITKSAFYH